MGRGLRVIGFPHVSAFKDRHGKIRYRYRRKGAATAYLPGLPGSPEFAEAYATAVSGAARVIGASRTAPGTINALVVAAYQSAAWQRLRPTTQITYRGIIERIREESGDKPFRRIEPKHIHSMLDKLAATPAAAHNRLKVMRWLLAFAVERQMMTTNPAAVVKPLKYDSAGFHTWSEGEIAAFEKRWPVGTRERLAFDLLLCTAQRSSDVRQMGRQHIADDFIRVRQEKTKAELDIPILPQLAASLATVPAGQMLFLVTKDGAGFTKGGFGNWFRDACRSADLPHCCAHGLRKSAATRLADAGCSESQIMAVTGHATAKEVQRYTRQRDQRLLAASALAKIGTNAEQKLATPKTKLAKSPRKRLN